MSAEPEETNTAARNQMKLLTSVISLQWRIQTFRWGGGGGHPDSEVTGGPGLKRNFFGPHFVLKITEGRRTPRLPPLDPPLD